MRKLPGIVQRAEGDPEKARGDDTSGCVRACAGSELRFLCCGQDNVHVKVFFCREMSH